MAQHFLDRPKVRAVLQEMGSEGMADGMRAYSPVELQLARVFLDDLPETLPGELAAVMVQEEHRIARPGQEEPAAVVQVEGEIFYGLGSQRDDAFLGSFAEAAQVSARRRRRNLELCTQGLWARCDPSLLTGPEMAQVVEAMRRRGGARTR